MLRNYKFSRIIMKNEILEYEIRSDPHQELHLQFSPDLFRHRYVATGDMITYTYHEPLLFSNYEQ